MMQVQPQRVKLAEYRALGLSFEIMDYAFPTYDEDEIKRAYEGIEIPSMHGAFIDVNFASNDPLIREVSQRRVVSSIEKGIALGVQNVVLHTCFYPVIQNDALEDVWCDLASDFLTRVVDTYHVRLLIENTLDLTPGLLSRLMTRLNHPEIQVCLDVGHANLSRTPLETWFEALHPYLRYMHLNDNHGVYDEHLAIGDGTIDWGLWKRLMQQYALDPIMTIEMVGVEKIQKSVEFLRLL